MDVKKFREERRQARDFLTQYLQTAALLGVGSFGTAYLVECQSDKALAVIK